MNRTDPRLRPPATYLALLLLALPLAPSLSAAETADTPFDASALLQSLVLETEDQDFERDRACLRNAGGEGVWKDANTILGFLVPHGLKEAPGPQDVRISPPAGLEVASVESQDQVVIVTLVPGPEGYTFLAGGLTCIDLQGLDYRADLPQGWFSSGVRAAPPVAGD